MRRVQRKRTKGFRLPGNTKCVNRGTKWGNPFKVVRENGNWIVIDKDGILHGDVYPTKADAAKKSVECYAGYIDIQISQGDLNLEELRGKNLACFCPLDSPCHADYLLQLLSKKHPIPLAKSAKKINSFLKQKNRITP